MSDNTPEGAAGHTPERWSAELDSADQLRHIWRTDEDGEPEKVAVVVGDYDDDFDPAPARRARLIAAAPDLLGALIWAEAALAPFSKEPAEKSGINLIRAAISRATGAA